MKNHLIKVGIGVVIGIAVLITGVTGVGKDPGINSLKESIGRNSDIKSITSDVYVLFKEDDETIFEANSLIISDKEKKETSGNIILHTNQESEDYNLFGDVNGIVIREDIENGKEYNIGEGSNEKIEEFLNFYENYNKTKKDLLLDLAFEMVLQNYKKLVTEKILENGTKEISILINEDQLNQKSLNKVPDIFKNRKNFIEKIILNKFVMSLNTINKDKFQISVLENNVKFKNIDIKYIVDNDSIIKSSDIYIEVCGLDKDKLKHEQSIKIETEFTEINNSRVNENIFDE